MIGLLVRARFFKHRPANPSRLPPFLRLSSPGVGVDENNLAAFLLRQVRPAAFHAALLAFKRGDCQIECRPFFACSLTTPALLTPPKTGQEVACPTDLTLLQAQSPRVPHLRRRLPLLVAPLRRSLLLPSPVRRRPPLRYPVMAAVRLIADAPIRRL